MKIFWLLIAACVCLVAAVPIVPSSGVFHSAWYNVLTIASAVFASLRFRAMRKTMNSSLTAAAAIALAGCWIVAVDGAASGLLGPDTQIAVGAPGTTVPSAAGPIAFPLNGADIHRRYTGSAITWPVPRTVVSVSAADVRGNALTITQPSGAAFLSPVLLMQRTAQVAGMTVPVDGFAVPAIRRNVKALLLSHEHISRLRFAMTNGPAVLFAVADAADRTVRGGIGIVPSGAERLIGGLRLRATVENYPAIAIASAPYVPVFLLGCVCLAGGVAATLRARMPLRSKT